MREQCIGRSCAAVGLKVALLHHLQTLLLRLQRLTMLITGPAAQGGTPARAAVPLQSRCTAESTCLQTSRDSDRARASFASSQCSERSGVER